jgi:hypothetical protein
MAATAQESTALFQRFLTMPVLESVLDPILRLSGVALNDRPSSSDSVVD